MASLVDPEMQAAMNRVQKFLQQEGVDMTTLAEQGQTVLRNRELAKQEGATASGLLNLSSAALAAVPGAPPLLSGLLQLGSLLAPAIAEAVDEPVDPTGVNVAKLQLVNALGPYAKMAIKGLSSIDGGGWESDADTLPYDEGRDSDVVYLKHRTA
jgi:hypothetical protein